MKKLIISCAVVAPLLGLNLQAQSPVTVGWRPSNNGSTDNSWNTAANWSPARVPGVSPAPGDKAAFNSRDQIPCILTNLGAPSQFVVGDNNPGVLIIAKGGTLVSSNYAAIPTDSWNAIGYNSMARVEVQNGGTLISSNHLWIGLNRGAMANFVLNGGTATILGMIGVGWSGGLGTVMINGGTLNLAQWNDTDSIKPLSQFDIRAGTVVITNDHTASIADFISQGLMTGYGGVGTVDYTYDTNSNTTILTATKPPGSGGPYPAGAWPTNINPNAMVHFWSADGLLPAPNENWVPSLGLATGSDPMGDVTLQGLAGKQATGNNINVYDEQWPAWNTNGLIDILVSMYGDGNVLRSALDPNQCRRFQFYTGTLPTDGASIVYGGTYPTNAYNSQWNWVLFTITNNLQSNLVDRLVGSLRTNATGSTNYGGINGGTIRFQGPDNNMNGLSIRALAFGQHGAFGTAPDINQFAPPSGTCPPVLDVNLAGIDLKAGSTNHLVVINDAATGQDVTFVNNVGPADDQRQAVIPNGMYLNFGITDNYLGQPCNDNVVMKVCVDYYDDPALAGAMFGPYAYATDALGDITYLPFDQLATLQGTGRWVRQSWTFPSVNLAGVSTAPLTGGPQFLSPNGQVAVSRAYIGVLRNTGPLAGQDPLADCYPDPNICTGVYSNYAQLDLANAVTNGVDLGTSSGDQTFVVGVDGPAGDQRLSVRVDDASPGKYLNFQVLTNTLGPISQGNLHLSLVATYYDDPAKVGQNFRPEVWTVQQLGSTILAHMPSSANVVLQGTGKWRDAYWEIGKISLDGVNQHPAAARFSMSAPISICRIQYAVVRPCGATAGENLLRQDVLLGAGLEPESVVRLSWPYAAPQAVLQGAPTLNGPWGAFGAPVVEGGENLVLRFGPTNAPIQFFRLSLTPQ